MLESILKPKSIIFGLLLSVFGIGFPFLLFAIIKSTSGNTFPYYILFFIFVFIFGLLSYVSGDIILAKYKKDSGDINPVYPKEVIDKSNELRSPFVISLVLTLLALAGLFIAYLIMGRWPLL
mgnify:CR=1 FL=1